MVVTGAPCRVGSVNSAIKACNALSSRVFLLSWEVGAVALGYLLWSAIVPFGIVGNSHVSHVAQLFFVASVEGAFIGAAFAAALFVTWRVGFPLMLTLPVAWVAQEWARSVFPWGGFPWGFLGYAAVHELRLIQFSEFTGVYGVSALIVVVAVAIFQLLSEARSVRAAVRIAAPALGLVLAALIFGSWRIHQLESAPAAGRLRIAMAQGNIAPTRKWDPAMLAPSFKAYSDASAWAAARGVDLIVWPETAAPFDVQANGAYPWGMKVHEEYRKKLLTLADSLHTPILTGAPAIHVERGEVSMRNRAYLVSARGNFDGYYDKIHLLQFGEYVPMRSILGKYIKKQVEAPFDFSPGDRQTLFHVKNAKLGVLICYESIYPDLARRAVDRGADILVNITNDAYFGKTSIPHQLFAMASMRAVENHTPMVRVANSGISAVITPTGRIIGATQLFARTTEIQTVQWKGIRTVYSRIGDVFARSCFALTIVGVLMAFCAKPGQMR